LLILMAGEVQRWGADRWRRTRRGVGELRCGAGAASGLEEGEQIAVELLPMRHG
jgi:hypothetical protein